ncbi:MAG: CYTH domain-containing protein [Deltaproteobacteria bacterium]|nr:CYTH domain-containing protein [Deltaproteobacteria bacterium]
MSALETEVKLTVPDAAAFERVLAAAGPPASVTDQLNVYLDTVDRRVVASGMSLRLRIARGGQATWTRKRRRGKERGAFVAEEAEAPADREAAVAWSRAGSGFALPDLPELSDVVRAVSGAPLTVVTWSLTRRTACGIAPGLEVELDETRYPDGTTDWEIEAEHHDPEAALAAVEALCAAAGVRAEPSKTSKQARARAHFLSGAPIPVDAVDP